MKGVEEQSMWGRRLKPFNFFKVSRKIKNFLSVHLAEHLMYSVLVYVKLPPLVRLESQNI